jgi:hypothetical protein
MNNDNRRIVNVPIEIAKSTMAKIMTTAVIDDFTNCIVSNFGGDYGPPGTYRQIQPVQSTGRAVISRGRLAAPFKPWKDRGEIYKVPIHHLAWKAKYGTDPPIGMEVSHLCGNATCCYWDHLCIETHANNIARIGCLGTVHSLIACHCGEEIDVEILVCDHQPSCAIVTYRT